MELSVTAKIAMLLSVQTGKIVTEGVPNGKNPLQKEWQSGFFKSPVSGKVFIAKTGPVQDEIADRIHHGGIDKAVFANSFGNYSEWAEILKRGSLLFGAMGENLTIDGIDERSVCIGDRHQTGSAILEVSQPRRPCWKISRRWSHPQLTQIIYETGKTGWYYRVVQEGFVQEGQEIILLDRPYPKLTIEVANMALKEPSAHPEETAALIKCPALAQAFKTAILGRIGKKSEDLEPWQMLLP